MEETLSEIKNELLGQKITPRNLERKLKSQGFSNREALMLVVHAKRQGITKEPGTVTKWTEKIFSRKRPRQRDSDARLS